MRFKLKDTKETNELLTLIGSKDKNKSYEAQVALGAFLGPVAQKVINQAGTSNILYTTETYNIDDSPSIALDTFYNESENYITIWSQPIAGGLATNQTAGVTEVKVSEYKIDSAFSCLKKWARRSRLDVVSKSISKMLNEVLIKQEVNAWSVAMRAVAEASTNSLEHVIDATTDNIFQIDDLNRLMTRNRRINTAFNAGTPDGLDSRGVTDLFVSPEIMEQVRAFAYQPMNTRGVPNSDESTAVPLPDAIRERIFNGAGTSEIYGITLHEVLEFGDTGRWNRLFDNYYSGSVTMAHGTDQVLLAADLSREGLIRLLAKDGDTGSTFDLQVDDQFLARSEKFGSYGSLMEGRICVDPRPYTALVV